MVNKVKFNRENVVELASQLFWQKGFNATSTRDLQDAVDMRPGSIYAAFGSKEGLYGEALKCYALNMKKQLDDSLANHDTVLAGLKAFVIKVTHADTLSQPSEICMLVKANAEFDDSQPTLKQLSSTLLDQFEMVLTNVFAQAQQQGELATELAAIDYARLFQIQFTGLRSYLHRPQSAPLARQLIDSMFDSLKAF